MEPEILYTPIPTKISFRSRIQRRLKTTYALDRPFWRMAMGGLWILSCYIFSIIAISMPTGLGSVLDIMLTITLGTIEFALSAHFIALLLALLGLPIPRLFTGGVIFSLVCFYLSFWIPGSGVLVSIISSIGVTALGVLLGFFISIIHSKYYSKRIKIWLTCGMLLSLFSVQTIPDSNVVDPTIQAIQPTIQPIVSTNSYNNPAEPGPYAFQYFTYGSGFDLHRSEFDTEVDLLSSPVNASAYIKKWSLLRTLFWGFNQNQLPINGRVWMPEGEGPFPLVLMVHGNHLMEDYSDEGYGYLGELLASRGFITVSVDENFLNYSVWANIPDNDMTMRAWVLLKHLQQIRTFAEQEDTPFSDKVDLDNIGLIGHSRGGQAVAMAADSTLWFDTDSDQKDDLHSFGIQGLVALAPTDSVIDNKQTKLSNISYMALQGAKDGDLNEYFGERHYARATFTPNHSGFKTYLHIGDANHSQFNSSWGDLDLSVPKGLFLNQQHLMEGTDQRQIAKVFVSAFLETVLHKKEDYINLFQDYRSGAEWLPDTTYFNKYEDGTFVRLARFEEDNDKTTLLNGGTAAANGLNWSEKAYLTKNDAVVLEWNEEISGDHTPDASYSLVWDNSSLLNRLAIADGISFSIANQSADLKHEQGETQSVPEIKVALQTHNDLTVIVPLSQFMTLKSPDVTYFTKSKWLEKHFDGGKYDLPEQPIFQTVRIPFDVFRKLNSSFNPANIKSITFYFSGGPGKIMLDDLGLYRD
ncbi:dienelactone hydrolase [Paenibacillus sp. DS2015]|uniref:alpha/beta hydrolase family protein n=1 Tax=Paenibacillus sp. DS2015 TaxID=3373917 RepID=UPI003D205FF6